MAIYRRLILLLFILLCPSLGHADCGLIPFKSHVQIYEPNQRAIIAWNGEEEILILATDLRASASTKVLQVFPCRNEPTVKKASQRVFRAATEIINRFYVEQNPRPRFDARFRTAGPAAGAAAPLPPAGFVAFHEQIGRHNVSVTQVLDPDRFLPWAEEYLRSQGADTPRVGAETHIAMKHYIESGFRWMVYDVAEVGRELRSNEPLQYRFKTKELFYPLVLTKTADERVSVEILVLTNGLLTEYPELPREQVKVGFQWTPDASNIMDEMAVLDQDLLHDLDPDIAELMGPNSQPMLRRWTLIPDEGSRFHRDLVAR